MWQDKVIAGCQLLFFFAMLPSIRSKDKPAFMTSLMNCILVSIIVTCFVTLGLWFSVITALPAAGCWMILAIQKWQIQKSEK